MIKILQSGQVVTNDAFFAMHPNVAFPVPLSNDALSEFGAQLAPEDLSILRIAARAKINAWRDGQESSSVTFSCNGRLFDADLKSKNRIAQVLDIGAVPPDFFWTDANNIDVQMTFEELIALGTAITSAIVARGWNIHRRQRELKLDVETMSAEQLQLFSPGWPI